MNDLIEKSLPFLYFNFNEEIVNMHMPAVQTFTCFVKSKIMYYLIYARKKLHSFHFIFSLTYPHLRFQFVFSGNIKFQYQDLITSLDY